MKLKTFVDLVSVSTNLYLLSKDKELMNQLYTIGEQSKDKASEVWNEISDGNVSWEEFMTKVNERAEIAKAELETKIEEVATKMYTKMHIATTTDLEKLKLEVENLKKQNEELIAKISNLQN
jgi:polyhydroxyalkanoate synthesis regulator phasin